MSNESATGAKAVDEQKYLEYLKRLTADLRSTREALSAIREREHEPIAIVGMACRYPGGVRSPEQLWELVDDGVDAISTFPADRGWPIADPSAAQGGFLHDAGEFDAGFFSMGPREALATDPQQRLMLEVAWESLERAGIVPAALRASDSGVFIGAAASGYGVGVTAAPEGIEGHLLAGGATSVISGRIAYHLGWEGPVATVDTACSSSLVAMHLAVQALRRGECSLALAGGVAVMATPAMFAQFSAQQGLAADGRVKAFSDSADGTVWSEGAGVLLLERLSDAQRNGRRILGLVRGTAINSDGASNGLTAPNGPSQQRVIRAALTDAGLTPAEVDAVDAHGTGTSLGDPIEAQALLATYGQDRNGTGPLLLGALKSNIGHTQSAAGVGGVIKMLLAMRHGRLPRTLHVNTPSTKVDWSEGAVELLTEPTAWPVADRPRRSAVSSFGISGTNAHVVLEQAPEPVAETRTATTVSEGVGAWLISARSAESLAGQAAALAEYTERSAATAGEIAAALVATRSTYEHRAVVLGADRDELVDGTRALAASRPHPDVVTGTVLRGRTAFLFPGQGSQHAGMGARLAAASPVAAAAFDEIFAAFDRVITDGSLREVMFAPADSESARLLDDTRWTQPALFAVEVATFRLWESWGVTPQLLIGHSVGALAAAHVAGVLSLEDAATLVATRARVMSELPAGGAMAAIASSEEEVRATIGSDERVDIATINGPSAVVVSGVADAVDALVARYAERGVRCTRLRVSHAFHSALMEPALAELRTVAAGLTFRPARIPIISDQTGRPADTAELTDPNYWVDHIRKPVRFADAIATARARSVTRFLEVGPGRALSTSARTVADGDGKPLAVMPGFRSGRDEYRELLTAAALLHVAGVTPSWPTLLGTAATPDIDLPTYAFDRTRFWLTPTFDAPAAPTGTSAGWERSFWEQVEREDVDALVGQLGDQDGAALAAVVPALAQWHRDRRIADELARLRLRVTWSVCQVPTSPMPAGTWIVLGANDSDPALAALRATGLELRITADDDFATVLSTENAAGVVAVPPAGRDAAAQVAALTAWLRTLATHAEGRTATPRLWVLTRGAVSTSRRDPAPDPAGAAVWGAGRALALERSDLWGGLIDLPADDPDDRTLGRLRGILAGATGEDQVALRAAGALARRIERAPEASDRTDWSPRGTVLITGGTGALGAHVARLAARRGAAHLVLLGRRGAQAPGAAELEAELRALGAEVTLAAADAADRDALAAVLARIDAGPHPLTAVVHAAGVGDDTPLAAADDAAVRAVLDGKALGAEHLDALTADRDLDQFVLFSSISAAWGAAGQCAYAAANARLDALAERRIRSGKRATSVAWGPWSGSGMAADPAADAHLRRRGLNPMDPVVALVALERALSGAAPVGIVADVDWQRFLPAFTVVRPAPLFDAFAAALDTPAPDTESRTAATGSELVEHIAAAGAAQAPTVVLDVVRAVTAGVLGHAGGDAVDPDRTFGDLGVDSVAALALRDGLVAPAGRPLPATAVFDHPTPRALAHWLLDELVGAAAGPAVPAATTAAIDNDPIVIVGLGCRFPGGVDGPDSFWELLAGGRDVIGPLPDDRGWDPNLVAQAPGGGFLSDAGGFDAAFFGISPREALAMDPQQRVLLEVVWSALEHAGMDPVSLRDSRTGVFIGSNGQEYATALAFSGEDVGGHVTTGTAASVLSGRISYTLGLSGPSVTVDTACSASLVALHQAVHAVRAGECERALAGGVTVMAGPGAFAEFSRLGALSVDGRCRAFADGEGGTGWGEGCGVVVVERLSAARARGGRVLAVVRGSAINSDGASNGLTAPNGVAQQRVLRDALEVAGVRADDIDAIEAHGTGTALGDPIEASALQQVFGGGSRRDPLWLGSVKSNIGHTQAAAGIAGVIKMVLALSRGWLPATLHANVPSRHVNWDFSVLELVQEGRRWPERETGTRFAGVSAFGMSGTNAHMVLQAPEPVAESDRTDEPAGADPVLISPIVPWIFSARTRSALTRIAEGLIPVAESGADLSGVARALLRRSTFGYRAMLPVDSGHHGVCATARLQAFTAAQGAGPVDGIMSGVAESSSPRTVFVFSGQGGHWAGMGAGLWDTSPVFRARLSECADALAEVCDLDVVEVLRSGRELEGDAVVQPVTWAVMVALAAMWRAAGVTPYAVVGHSQGEVAAAVVAGALSVADGARVMAARSGLVGALAGSGGMVSFGWSEAEVREHIAELEGGDALTVAALNGPASTVVAGPDEPLGRLMAVAERAGVRNRRVAVDYPSHSPAMDALRPQLLAALDGIEPADRTVDGIRWWSTARGGWLDPAQAGADYWFDNLRQPVQFLPAIEALLADGCRVLIEAGPHPTLRPAIWEIAESLGLPETGPGAVTAIATLRRDADWPYQLLCVFARAWMSGVDIDWSRIHIPAETRSETPDLPTYPFEHTRFWPAPPALAAPTSVDAAWAAPLWDGIDRADVDALATELAVAPDAPFAEVVPALAAWRDRRREGSMIDGWRYHIAWHPLPDPAPAHLTGTWLRATAAGAPGAVADEVARVLRAAGATVVDLEVAADLGHRSVAASRLRALVAEHGEFAGVIGLTGLLTGVDDAFDALHPTTPRGLTATLHLVQALGDAGVTAPLWLVTRGGVSIGPSDRLSAAEPALIWGFGRVAATEHPDRVAGLIDLPASVHDGFDDRAARRFVGVLARAGALGAEDQLALRDSGILARRFVRFGRPAAESPVQPWRPRGTVLVTGGTGAIGGHLARWLARGGAEHLVLVSRRGPQAAGAAELTAELEALGARVTVVACDVGDPAAVADLLAEIDAGPSPLRAVMHAAGALDDGLVQDLDADRFEIGLRPKAGGAMVLDLATRGRDLDAFVLFSSTSGVLGGTGLGNYAPGNAFLDALALLRRDAGERATAIAWGHWGGEGGMARGEVGARLQRYGVVDMAPETALQALQVVLDHDETTLVVAAFDWQHFAPAFVGARPAPLLAELPDAQQVLAATRGGTAERADRPALVALLADVPPKDRPAEIGKVVRSYVAAILGHSGPEAIVPGTAFRDLGIDSLTAVELRNALGKAVGMRLPATLVFDYPTPAALTEFIIEHVSGSVDGLLGHRAARPDAPATTAVGADPVVIVGMSCRFPGGVRTPEDLWDLLVDGRDAMRPFPTDRGWDLEALYSPDPDQPGTSYARDGGFLVGAAEFDAEFFGISPREALAMDPQQRVLLEVSWEALERAGIDPSALRGSATGVFAGTNGQDYAGLLVASGEDVGGYIGTGNAAAVLSGRVAYALGLEGPAVTVDTACSASLVALHQAAAALRSGECDLALAGGATVMATPGLFQEFSRQRGLSADGRCKAFADAADGTGFSEGAAVLVLARQSDAVAAGYPILAVVRGSAINSDGASNGLTAPNGPSQQRVIRSALAMSGLTPAEVDMVEAHGTGTTLGDPIEAQAVLATYGQDREQPLWLGSIKSNLGHTQAAAGVAGVMKSVLALQHGRIPATLHVDAPSSHVDWSAGAVELVTETVDWPQADRPRRAGVSSFGISGTNAHVIIEQAPEPTVVAAEDTVAEELPVLPLILSGRTPAARAAQAGALAELCADTDPRLPALASALGRRTAFDHRAVVLASDRDGAHAGLGLASNGDQGPNVVAGSVISGSTGIVFAGQGSQHAGMGRDLYAAFDAYADAFDQVCVEFDRWLDRPLRDVVFGSEPGLVDRTGFTQPALFAFEVALYRLLESWGLRANVVLGHSIGEIVAAHVAGVLTLADAVRLVAARAGLMEALPEGGVMVAVACAEEVVAPLLAGHADTVGIAAVNGPHSVVLSGLGETVDSIVEILRDKGIRTRRLTVSHAFHSPLVEPMLAEFERVVAELEFAEPRIALVSALTGTEVGRAELSEPQWWVRHVREAVRFADAVEAAAAAGATRFVELAPRAVLRPSLEQALGDAVVISTGTRAETGTDAVESVVAAVARLWVTGGEVNPVACLGDATPGATELFEQLPTYPFQHRHYWPVLDHAALARRTDPRSAADEFWRLITTGEPDDIARALGIDTAALAPVLPALAAYDERRRDTSATDGLRLRVAWRKLPEPAPAALRGRWLVACAPDTVPHNDFQQTLIDALDRAGADIVRLTAEDRGDARAAWSEALRPVLGEPIAGVVSLLAAADPEPEQPVPAGYSATIALVQALTDARVAAPVWAVTVDAGAAPDQAMAASFLRVAGLEHPELRGGIVDFPDRTPNRQLTQLFAAAVAGRTGEDEIRLRDGAAFGRRLVTVPAAPATEPGRFAADGTVLVTGGTGAIGGHLARWCAANGAAHLVLVGARGPQAPGATELAAELADLGATVDIVAADAADRTAMRAVLDGLPADRPLRAVIHAAAVLDDATIAAITPEQVARALRVKVGGAQLLDELTADADLEAFVLVSSLAGVLGALGQGNYAPGNAALDALAEARTRRGLLGSAVAFGSWAGGGMVDGELDARLRAAGMRALQPARATAAFGAHLAAGKRLGTGGPAYEIVADFDWTRFTPAHLAGRPDSRLLAEIPAAREFLSAAKEADTPAGGLAALLSELPAHEHALTVGALVRRHVAAVLGHDGAEAIDPVVTFGSLGVESLAAVEIRNVLSGVTGLALPPTLVYDYPTPAAVTDYLLGLVQPEEPARPAPVRTPRPGGGDPVAVVGIGCRFPGGADTPERFWELLLHGTDAVGDWPDRRQWDLLIDPADTITTRGAFLDEIDGFDPAFFGISPREALAMDPQQRLLLEICWEATERAGIDPSTLRGSRTGVFVGTNSQDYASRPMELRNGAEAQLGTGTSASVLSGRISYVLGAEGPSMTVDTACSSSLVALHLAARELRSGDCDLVLAGGVTVMSTPGLFAEFTRQGGLAADGRCKAFADEADGTGWGEGAGILVLERLSDARAAGHPVLAVLSGTAVNSDGTSNGLTAPNGLSQERVIRSALEAADLTAEDVDLIEAHGTGTTLGDPIEARALLNTYGGAHRDRPLWLGSVKSNIGHTQAAAGVAGVIKAILALRHETVPATLHAETPTRHVDWTTGGIELVQAPVAWPANGRPRHAGVSAFGLSGTNAHVIIGDAPADDRPAPEAETPRPTKTPIPWVLSARTPAALAELAQRVAEHTDGTDIDPMAVARTLATGRATFEERAVVLGSDIAALSTALRAVCDENAPATTTLIRGKARRGRTAVVFTGQGGQRPGIGAELATAFPVFAAAVEEVVAALRAAGGDEVADAVTVAITEPAGSGDAAWLDRTELAQPTLFALSTALFRLLESWGVDIDVVTGHSVGEIVAAHVAGVLTLDAAARFVVARGRAMAALPEAGGMLSITAGEDVVSTLLDDLDPGLRDRVSVAAVNGPAAVVVAGGDDALAALAERAADRGLRTRPLRVSHAFHSPLMRPCLDELAAAAETAARDASAAVRSVVSTLTGASVGHGELADPAHWVEHARRPVRFADAVAALREQGVTRFLEVGPDAGLAAVIAQGVADEEPEARPVAVPLLRRNTPEPVAALAALAALYADGGQLDWARLLDDGTARAVLPTYPFQRRSYWLRADATPVTAAVLGDMRHPLVPVTLHDPTGGVTLAGRLSLRAHRWLTEHTIGGTPIVPGAAFVDLAIRAGDETDAPCVEELLLDVPLPLDTGDLDVRVMVAPATEDGRRTLTVHARPADDPDAAWTRHARGRLGEPGETLAALGDWPPADADPIEGTPPQWYADAEAAGFAYGPVFRGLRRVWTAAGDHGTDVFAEVALPDDAHPPADAFALHPALLDAATHALVVAGSRLTTDGVLPFLWAGVTLHLEGARALRVWFRAGANPDEFAVVATDTEGTPVFEATALRLRPAADRTHAEDAAPQGIPDDGLVLAVPRTVPLDAEVTAIAGRRWAVVGDDPFDVAATLDAVNVHLEVYSEPHVLAQACEFGAVAPPVLFTGIAGADPESGSTPAELAPRRCAEILDLVRALVAEPALADSRLAVLLRGARPDGELADPVSAAVAGFVRTLAAEHPGRLVLVHVDADVPQADSLAAAVTSGHGEVVLRDGTTHLPAWQRREVPPTPGTQLLREPGTVLVTGATGGLGTVMVRHLVADCGVRRLVLASRSGTEVADLADAEITAVACDVTDRAALAALVDGIADLRAIVHIAGVIDDATAATMRPEQIDRVFAPKAEAAWALHELTADRDLDAFVLFSSAAGPLGSAGQANYAAANAFLDALAAHRRGLGLPGTAIAWGSWAPIEVTGRETRGMTARATGSDRARVAGYGMRPILAAEGARLFDAALAAPAAAVLALAVANRSRSVIDGPATGFEELVGGGKARPTRRRAAASSTEATKAAPAAGAALPTDPAARRQALAGLVIARVAEVLGHDDTAEVTGDMSFVELGIDSLTAVELRNRLEAATGLRLPPTIVFDVAGPGDLADYLADRLDQAGSATADTDRAAAEVVAAPEETLAGLFRVAVEQGKMDEGFALLQAAAELRPTFTGPADLERRPVPIRLVSEGRTPTPIFAFSSYVALAGVHQYARLASLFRGDRTFWALPAPGFGTGEPLPASLDAVARLQAEDVLARCGDTPPILLGSSSGGTLAQATADELTRRGVRPAAIVLIDTYHPKVDSPFARFAAEMIGGMFDREETFARMTVDRLSAMSWYLRTIGEWEPPTGPEPILLLRAGDPPVDLRAEDGTPLPKAEWQTSYERADLVLDVPGNHFTMMETHARSTAAAIRDWLATVLAEHGPEDKKD